MGIKMAYLDSLEKRMASLEKWQRLELIMLGTLISEKGLEILLSILT